MAVGITLRIGRVNARAEIARLCRSCRKRAFHPEHVITRKVRFEDAHEAIAILPSALPLFAMELNDRRS